VITISSVESSLNIIMDIVFIIAAVPKKHELRHNFKGIISYPCIMIFSYRERHERALGFHCVYSEN
jgi:hypothetical protein